MAASCHADQLLVPVKDPIIRAQGLQLLVSIFPKQGSGDPHCPVHLRSSHFLSSQKKVNKDSVPNRLPSHLHLFPSADCSQSLKAKFNPEELAGAGGWGGGGLTQVKKNLQAN